jgi:hypothetical protein
MNLDFVNSLNIIGGKSLFVLYLIISANFLANLFGCKIQYAMHNNMYVKHLLGLLTLYFFVSITEGSSDLSSNPYNRLLFTLAVYLWFILTTNMKYTYWLPMIFAIGIIYILNIYIDYEGKKEIKNDKLIEMYKNIQKVLFIISIVLTISGFVNYWAEKKIEFGSEFSFSKFISGHEKTCRNNDITNPESKVSLSFFDSIKVLLGNNSQSQNNVETSNAVPEASNNQ